MTKLERSVIRDEQAREYWTRRISDPGVPARGEHAIVQPVVQVKALVTARELLRSNVLESSRSVLHRD